MHIFPGWFVRSGGHIASTAIPLYCRIKTLRQPTSVETSGEDGPGFVARIQGRLDFKVKTAESKRVPAS
jgi:hypothetical protein